MSLIQGNSIEGGAGYEIQKSLRFRASAQAYLSRTPSVAGNRRTWTWSGWVKRGAISTVGPRLLSVTNASTYDTSFFFNSNDTLRIYSAAGLDLITTAVYRDPSAHFHLLINVDTTQATASNRAKVWVNGVAGTSFSTATYPAQNTNLDVNAAVPHEIGRFPTGITHFDGYLSEVNFIDGQALDPSYFGQVSAETGSWIPKKYTGTYGTNGFYLPFNDGSTLGNLAADRSGNGNNWTANNISLTAGATYDSMTDVPTLTSASAANYCVLNPLAGASVVSVTNGNLTASETSASGGSRGGTFGVSSGKWYWEVTPTTAYAIIIGAYTSYETTSYNLSGYAQDGNKYTNQTGSAYGASFIAGNVIGVALDLDAGTLSFYKNGVSQGIAFTGLTGTWFPAIRLFSSAADFNFGQRPFSYTPPTGFKALCTFNLPDPVIKNGLTVFDATTWTGFGTTTQVNVSGKFKPDLVWIKGRSGATSHRLTDSVRGATYALSSDSPSSNTITDTQGLTSFNSGGFTVGSNTTYNANGSTYIAWQWKKGATQGFDISSVFTGTGAAQTVNHSLGVAPSMIILFSTGGTNWINTRVYHKNLTAGYALQLSTAAAQFSEPATFASIGSSSFQTTQTSGQTSIAYLFAEIPGFSKIGSYTGNGSADGPFVYCGFRPKYVMFKKTSAVSNWSIVDTARDLTNVTAKNLKANLSNAEATATATADAYLDIISNGFKLRGNSGDINDNASTYIYAAFAETPFKYSNAR